MCRWRDQKPTVKGFQLKQSAWILLATLLWFNLGIAELAFPQSGGTEAVGGDVHYLFRVTEFELKESGTRSGNAELSVTVQFRGRSGQPVGEPQNLAVPGHPWSVSDGERVEVASRFVVVPDELILPGSPLRFSLAFREPGQEKKATRLACIAGAVYTAFCKDPEYPERVSYRVPEFPQRSYFDREPVFTETLGRPGSSHQVRVEVIRIEGTPFEAWARVLQEFVSEDGLIDFDGLIASAGDPTGRGLGDLALFIHFIAETDLEVLDLTDDQKKAAYFDFYNGAAMGQAVESEVPADLAPIGDDFGLNIPSPRQFAFFVGRKVTIGGERMSLYHFENEVIRKRVRDARLHFSLNCMTKGCPKLKRRSFFADAEDLDARLEEETLDFLRNRRNLTVHHDDPGIIQVSELFGMNDYMDDFLAEAPSLPAYIDPYYRQIQRERGEEPRSIATYEVFDTYKRYDWTVINNSD